MEGGGEVLCIRSRNSSFILPWGWGKQQQDPRGYEVPALKSLSLMGKKEITETLE